MAALECKLSGEGDELPRCSTLFLTEDGSQMNFYMTPCAMKTRLRPLIHHGGGNLSSKVLADSIKLASPGTGNNLPGYFSSDYIFDSIKHNRLQDLEKYSMKSLEASAHVTNSKSNGKSTSSSTAVSPSSGMKLERQRYTVPEDCALIKFVKENRDYYSVKGCKLYKRAEKAKITSHTWQSMMCHYLRVLRKKKHADIYRKASTLKGFVDQDSRLTGKTSRGKAKIGDKDKQVATDDTDDTNADQDSRPTGETSRGKAKIDQDSRPMGEATREKPKIGDKDQHVGADERNDTDADYLPDEARADNTDGENSTCEDVDYDKIFDDNLLKQAYKYKKKRESSGVENDATEDEDVDEESRVSSSQERGRRAITRNVKRPVNEQEELSDFDGEIVFRKDLKSPSAKKSHLEDTEDNKKPMAKRSKRDLESLPDDDNPSERDRKWSEAFFQFCHTLQSYLQKLEVELTVPQIAHALLVSSGYLADAEDYVQNGPGKEQWTSKEDKILLSKNKDDISRLSKKRGLNAVIDRMNFMEGIN